MYTDQVGAQGTISRFGLIPAGPDTWIASVHRHWFLDRPGPRSERDIAESAQAILRQLDSAQAEGLQDDEAEAPVAGQPVRE